jgi:hypothetical protein
VTTLNRARADADHIVERDIAVQATFRVLAQVTAVFPFAVAAAFTWPWFARARRHATAAITALVMLHVAATITTCV